MRKNTWLWKLVPAVVLVAAVAMTCLFVFSPPSPTNMTRNHDPDDPAFIMPTSEAGWREILPPEVFRVARQKGTERAFANAYWDEKTPGVYACYCCDQPLFHSDTKFDSGTGWPSFHQPVQADAVAEATDNGWFLRRTEVLCSRCGAHLGHVFDDAPSTPTGLRYCMNSAALHLKPDDSAQQEKDAGP